MSISLIFPPGWEPFQPYLSIPTLTSYLNHQGIDVIPLDLNIEFYDYIVSKKGIKNSFIKLEKKNFNDYSAEKRDQVELLNYSKKILMDNIEKAKRVLKSDLFYVKEEFEESVKVINMSLTIYNLLVPIMNISLRKITINNGIIDTDTINNILLNPTQTLFHEWYDLVIIPKLKKYKIKIFGISLINYDQIIPSLILADRIKKTIPDSIIIFGGDISDRLAGTILTNETSSKLVDFIIFREGEKTLGILIDILKDKGKRQDLLSKIPNLLYKDHNRIISNIKNDYIKMDKLPYPDFSKLPLNKYFSPKLILPLQISRGCYWNKCTFCEEVGKYYHEKSLKRIMNEILYQKKRYKTDIFFFVDCALSPKLLKNISNELISNEIKIKWGAFVRSEFSLNMEIVKKMNYSGCKFVLLGVESGSLKIQKLINKGINIEVASKLLSTFSEYNIWTHCYFIIGFPTENLSDAMQTLFFLKNNIKNINSASLNKFILCKQTGLYKDAKKLNIKIKYEKKNPWKIHFYNLNGDVMQANEIEMIEKKFKKVFENENKIFKSYKYMNLNHFFLTLLHEN